MATATTMQLSNMNLLELVSMQCATKSLMALRDFKKADFVARALA